MMIFCVEDDRGIRELMTYTLNASGYDALGLKDGKELDEALKNEKPCLITLDIMLPNEDGISMSSVEKQSILIEHYQIYSVIFTVYIEKQYLEHT